MALTVPIQVLAVEAFLEACRLPERTVIVRDIIAEMAVREPSFDMVIAKMDADKPLAQRLIYLANSAWYAGQVKVDSCASALTRCGSEDFCELTIYSAVRQALSEVSDTIWPQLEFAAHFCEFMAQEVDEDLAEEAHWAGLFHDYAIPFMAKNLTDYSYLMPEALGFSPEATQNEQECYALDHTLVAASLVRYWGFSEAVAEAIGSHHRAKKLTEGLSARGAKLAAILMIAKHVEAGGMRRSSSSFQMPSDSKLIDEAAAALGLKHAELKERVTEVCNQVAVRAVG